MPDLTDDAVLNALLVKAQASDTKAFDALTTLLRPQLERFLWRILAHQLTVDDVVQNTMIAMYMNLQKFTSVAHMRAFGFRVARNKSYDFLRRERRRPTVSLHTQVVPAKNTSPEDNAHWLLLYEKVQGAIDKLPAPQREVLLLHHEGKLTYNEIAQMLGIPEGTVKTRIFNARKKLVRALPPDIIRAIIADDG
ncbi:MAG: RNA polymerase sigma factor [Chloroflexota bacterium]